MRRIKLLLQNSYRRFRRNPLIQRVLRNTSYLFSAQMVSAALSMGQGILAARLLGVAGAGLVGIITQFSSSVNRLLSFRMGELVVTYVGKFHTENKPTHEAAVFKVAAMTEIIASILAFGLIVVLAPLAADIFAHDPTIANLFVLYGISILANCIAESSTGLLQTYNHFRTLAGITLAQSVLTIALIALAFFQQGGLAEIVMAYLAGKVAWGASVAIAALLLARREWGWRWFLVPSSLLTQWRRELIRFGISTNISGTLKLITRDSEMLWLGAFSTPVQVGYYKIARAITNVVVMPVMPLISTTYREMAREVASRQWPNVRYLMRSGTTVASLWTIPASIGLVLFGPWVVALYGAEFLPNSYITLLILLVGVAVNNLFYWNQLILLPLGLPDFPTKIQFAFSIVYIAGVVLLIPTYGAYGMAALSTLVVVGSITILVLKTLIELRKAELQPAFG